jgi:acetyl/propionyl-CoA carboxylase alpha subunit
MKRLFEAPDCERVEVGAMPFSGGLRLFRTTNTGTIHVEVIARRAPNGDWLLEEGGVTRPALISVDRQNVWVSSLDGGDDASGTVRFRRVETKRGASSVDLGVRSPMTGRVVAVHVQVGDQVEKNQQLVVVEAMKMEHVLRAPRAGLVQKVACAVGQLVEGGAELVELLDAATPD